MMRKYLLLMLCSIVLFACEEKEQKPDYLWEEERFVEVLTEFQKAEAIVRLGYHRSSGYLNDSVYRAVFRKMKVKEAEFDSNYNYYLKHPETLEKMYEQVIINLNTASAELEKTSKEKRSDQDSLE